jgi:hypothetical protein
VIGERTGRRTRKNVRSRSACPIRRVPPGRRQAGTDLLPFGIPRNNGGSSQDAVNPGDEAQSPISGIQTDDARADLVETDGPYQHWLCKRSIMDKGREKAERRWGVLNRDRGRYTPDSPITRGAHAERERARSAAAGSRRLQARMGTLSMMRSRVPMSRCRMACRTVNTKSDSCRGAPAARRRSHCCDGLGMRGFPSLPKGNPQASAKAGHCFNLSCIS